MDKQVGKKVAHGNGTDGGSSKPISQAQRRRDRQQVGVAESLAAEAERSFPALHAGVFTPGQLVRQTEFVLKEAKLLKERHGEGEISEEHVGHIITAVRLFAKALKDVGVKVPGLLRVKQHHYLDVMKMWEDKAPGEAHRVGWILCLLRRLLVSIGRVDVIPSRKQNIELLSRHGIVWGSCGAFLAGNSYFDWATNGTNVEVLFQAMPDPAKRAAARMMYLWGMSLLEVSAWQAVDPTQCSFLRVEGTNERRCSREAEFSSDPEFAARQMSAVREAWNYCRQQDRLTIRPSDLSPEHYAEQLRSSIRHALTKQFPDLTRLTPMQLRDGFFCQVFRDHADMSLQEARRNPQLAQEDRRFALAWNEAKRQIGVQGAKAPHAHKGTPLSWSQSASIARSLRSFSPVFANLRVGDAWVGDVDASAGKCLFVAMLEGAQASALLRLQELIQQELVVKLRVVPVQGAGDVPEGAARVLVRSVPV